MTERTHYADDATIAYIAELERKLEAAERGISEARDWIPVRQRKPEDNRDVLMYVICTKDNMPPTRETGYWQGMSWFCSVGMLTPPLKVTHWMPLPEAPK